VSKPWQERGAGPGGPARQLGGIGASRPRCAGAGAGS
jgi:hypothetical protein